MNADEKSHNFVVLMTQANKTATAVAESDEGRRSPKGSVIERRRCTGHRSGRCIHSTTRWPREVSFLSETFDPTEEPYEVILHVRICEGAAGESGPYRDPRRSPFPKP